MTVNTNTQNARSILEPALQGIPQVFRIKIIDSYISLRESYDEHNDDTTALRGGRFFEAVLRFLQKNLTNSYTLFGQQIPNFSLACRRLEQVAKSTGHESLRLMIPRALDFGYTLRNKRGIGHIGGDVEANGIDAATVARIADWCLCELMRIFHTLSLEEAQAILDAISVRQLPKVWTVAGKKRVLQSGLSKKSETLLLLHGEMRTGVPIESLLEWTEYGRMSDYKRWVLQPLHKERLIEFDKETDIAIITPKGASMVEREASPNLPR